jgi:hypothetical protein
MLLLVVVHRWSLFRNILITNITRARFGVVVIDRW